MSDLTVDTDALRATAVPLRAIVRATVELGAKSGRASSLVPALGLSGPAAAMDSFLSNWVYGVGCIGCRAHAIADVLESNAAVIDTVEENLRRRLQDPDNATYLPVPGFVATAMPEPVRPPESPKWTLLASVTAPMAPQLSQARHVGELIPGDPEQADDLAAVLDDFTNRLMDARYLLRISSLGGWHSATAARVTEALDELLANLTAAVNAFGAASAAVQGYVVVHSEAREQARRAMLMFSEAKHESDLFRGLIPGHSAPPGVVEDPGLYGMAVASRLLLGAREEWDAAAKRLSVALAEAEAGSPTDHGPLAHAARTLSSLGTGVALGTAGIVEGAVNLGLLGYGLFVAPATQPELGRKSWEAVGAGLWQLGTEPDDVLLKVLDVETLRKDPALWTGKLVPEALLIARAAQAGGVAQYTSADRQLRAAAETVRLRDSHGTWDRLSPTKIRERLDQMHLPPGSQQRAAALAQMRRIPPENPDQWYARSLHPGQRIAVYGDGNTPFVAVVSGPVTRDAQEFFGSLQVAPGRAVQPDGAVGQPTVPDKVRIYEVVGSDLDAAQTRALANPELGSGGSLLAYIRDLEEAIDRDHLVQIGPEHKFDTATTRTDIEDPRYRNADSTLPGRALDPDRARHEGQREEFKGEARRAAAGAAASGAFNRANQPTVEEDTAEDMTGSGVPR